MLIQDLLMVLRNGALETVVCEARMPSKPFKVKDDHLKALDFS